MIQRRTHILLLVIALLLSGCLGRGPTIADLERYPQEVSFYLPSEGANSPLLQLQAQEELAEDYERRFFAPWGAGPVLPAGEAFWGEKTYGKKQGYGENLQPIPPQRWDRWVRAQEVESYPSMERPAITVRNTSFRVMPTRSPFFLDPQLPGEGFPFDYFQNSAVWAGTPLKLTHRSTDGAWLFGETGSVSGWIPADAVAGAGEEFRKAYQTGVYAALLEDGVALEDLQGNFLAQGHIGALFPVAGCTLDGSLLLQVPVRDADGEARIRPSLVPSFRAAVVPRPLTPRRLAEVADEMLGQPYGWGGLYQNRDCSSTLRDLFTPFAYWLPRNSRKQAQGAGELIEFEGLSAREKRALILKEGIPFTTLLWFKGHIGLYLGPHPDTREPMMLHNFWGVKTTGWFGGEGRAISGRLAVTSLRPGEERWDVRRDEFYDRALGMTVLKGARREEK